MKISDLFAGFTALVARLDAAGKADLEAFKASVTTKVESLQSDLSASIAAEAEAKNKLATVTSDLSAANRSLTADNASITSAATALRSHLSGLPGHADYKDGGAKASATLTELIAAEQNATNLAIASTGVKTEKLPAAGAVPNAAAAPKNLTEACLKANQNAV